MSTGKGRSFGDGIISVAKKTSLLLFVLDTRSTFMYFFV
jgi:hypothetical protein